MTNKQAEITTELSQILAVPIALAILLLPTSIILAVICRKDPVLLPLFLAIILASTIISVLCCRSCSKEHEQNMQLLKQLPLRECKVQMYVERQTDQDNSDNYFASITIPDTENMCVSFNFSRSQRIWANKLLNQGSFKCLLQTRINRRDPLLLLTIDGRECTGYRIESIPRGIERLDAQNPKALEHDTPPELREI
ncbi:MAG: hypothetical protein SGJ27_01250 [Candidatus Melainabacteria bacterium]|nr:hypothetical protein [Candidatus Melainabacteria bacterium]